MNATDELCRLLDERGLEWKTRQDGVIEWVHGSMTYRVADRTTCGIEHLTMLVTVLTPEQAIAATLSDADLAAENAKLRNLIQRFSKWDRNGCHECPMEEDCKVLDIYDGDCGMAVEIEKEMRELGIEIL